MIDLKSKTDKKKFDSKEFELPETTFSRDIEDKVFQSIVLQCLSQIEGISLVEGNFIDHLLGRSSEGVKGIYAEQNEKTHSLTITVEVNIQYGVVIPQKAEEIQTKIIEEITKLTGLHVSGVHVVFKNVISTEHTLKLNQQIGRPLAPTHVKSTIEEEYTDEF